jgi:hypothetical protein
MLAALIQGERDPRRLAPLGPHPAAGQAGQLREAFTGQFTDHHGFLLARMLGRVDQASTDVAELDRKIEVEIAPFAQAVQRLDEIGGVGRTAAQTIIAEIGTDLARFPTLGTWPPGPATRPASTVGGQGQGQGHDRAGNPYLARVVGEAAVAAGRTDTFLGSAIGASPAAAAQEGDRGGGPLDPGHRLAPAGRPQPGLPRPGPWLLRHPRQRRARQAQPRPPTGGLGFQGHPRTCCLTRHPSTDLDPAPAPPGAAACPLTVDLRIGWQRRSGRDGSSWRER